MVHNLRPAVGCLAGRLVGLLRLLGCMGVAILLAMVVRKLLLGMFKFTDDTAPHINIFNISKINARDNKKGAAKSSVARVRRYQEYLGESYFDYLACLPDLVVLMDEAHRYYASAGAKAINDLRPVLGIELTATPKTVGANPRQFANIVYHYLLSRALQDGYVKIPAVATRKDFRADSVSAERLRLELPTMVAPPVPVARNSQALG